MNENERLERQYRLSEAARLRPESFGGLAYTFQDQKLYFISPPLMPFLQKEAVKVSEILEQVQKDAGKRYSQNSVEAILKKLEELEAQGVIEQVK
jgi:putative mycofactocin binding protein MftB